MRRLPGFSWSAKFCGGRSPFSGILHDIKLFICPGWRQEPAQTATTAGQGYFGDVSKKGCVFMEKPVNSKRKTILQFALLLLFLVALRLCLKSYIVQGPILEPELLHGDRVLVDMISPHIGSFKAGDIVLCSLPGQPGDNHLNRLVGLPGDVIEIIDHQVWVNGTSVPNSFTEEPDREQAEVVPEGQYFLLESGPTGMPVPERPPRHGLVAKDHLKGRAIWRFWPLSRKEVGASPN